MNKKGNIFLSIFVALFLFATGVLIMPFLADDITDARDNLNCSNVDISDGNKLICLSVSGIMPYFIWFFTSLSVGYLIGRNT